MKYLFFLLLATHLSAEFLPSDYRLNVEEGRKICVELWPFEDHYYMEYEGHLFYVSSPKHSIHCGYLQPRPDD